ncbi:MAG: AbrB/MazE/SpoVT family DNA-binding domain-containing protein [Ruminococcus sp.]|nr:AbrB/MazE/SpoVT family DNA-binding domain-containing protein [Ruminococcus sp.]
MKTTGIVRRIDDLGRVVIPKEIRRTMQIREGDPLEIYTSNDGEVIFKKYSPIGEMSESATQVAEIMHRLAECPVAVFDRDHVVSVFGATKKEWNARRVSPELEDLMEQRRQYFSESGQPELMPAEGVEKGAVACMPIIVAGDVTGAVAFLDSGTGSALNDSQKSLIQAASQFLGRQLES